MRYRIKEYSVLKHPVASLYNFVFALPVEVLNRLEKEEGSNILTEASKRYIIESVRLIADETQGGYVLMSSGQKGVVNDITESDGSVGIIINKAALIAAADGDADDIAAINAMANTDQFTIEMDWGDEPSGLSGGDAAEQVKDFFGIVKDGDTVKVVTEDGGEEVVVPVELATEQEVKGINDDVWGALYGYGMVAVTIHSLMRVGAETTQNSQSSQNSEQSQASENAQSYTTQDLASVIYVDPAKTWSANGYPTLYDDEGTAIDTTTNPAAGDEVFNYQIQSES